MSNDLLIPILICIGCLGLVLFVHFKTRSKPPPKTFSIPTTKLQKHETTGQFENFFDVSSPVHGNKGLATWHKTFETAVLDFIELADSFLSSLDNETEPNEIKAIDLQRTPEAVQVQEAAARHPSPEMGAELSALLATVAASFHAHLRGDSALSLKQRLLYLDYREIWFQRLRQFPQNLERIIRLRRA